MFIPVTQMHAGQLSLLVKMNTTLCNQLIKSCFHKILPVFCLAEYHRERAHSSQLLRLSRRHFYKASLTMAENKEENTINGQKKKVGLVQMTSTDDKDANFRQAQTLIEQAVALNAEMIFLPECFDYVGSSQKLAVQSSETITGPTIQKYKNLAKRHQIWLSLGGFHEKPADGENTTRIYNTHVVIDKEGEIRGKYSKIHLFNVDIKGGVRLQETDFTYPGTSLGPPIETPVGKVGMAICYDVRFPELSIALTQQGANILTFPSAFTVPTGKAHWETLLKCRAIESQCYVIAAAQVGQHNEKRSSYGHSMVVDPWGKVLVDCLDKVDVRVVEIDFSYLDKRRKEMPVWQHRRYDIYGTITAYSKEAIDSQTEYQFGQVKVNASHVFHRSALSAAFVNKKPVVPGHVLVMPIRPVERFSDMTQAEIADLFQMVKLVSSVMEKCHNASSVTIGIQDGPDAGQTIKHVHVHILPRTPNDFKRNDDIYEQLEKHDKNVADSEWRTDEDMRQEAEILRQYFT